MTLVSTAQAQDPEIINYTFNSGDATNTAVPGSGSAVGTNGGTNTYGPGGITSGANDPAAFGAGDATSFIDTGWTTDLGAGDWSIGFFLDATIGVGNTNFFQYVMGDSTAGSFRSFTEGASGDGNILLRGPITEVNCFGGVSDIAPVHVCWVHDSVAGEIRAYADGVLVNTVPQGVLNITGTGATAFYALAYNGSTTTMQAGVIMDEFRVYRRAIDQTTLNAWVALGGTTPPQIGTNYCAANANSTGVPGVISATGSETVASNSLTLVGSDLPNNSFGFFLASQTQGLVMNPGGSAGDLCLGGSIGRYVGPGQIQNTGAAGEISLLLDLTNTPQPTGPVAINAGETWNFTTWHRDAVGGSATSNFTDGLEILFL